LELVTLAASALVMSIAVERFAMTSGRWSYTANNPRIPGTDVSIVPVVQLLLLFPLTFWLAARIAGRTHATPERK
jgi:hypothetical protein